MRRSSSSSTAATSRRCFAGPTGLGTGGEVFLIDEQRPAADAAAIRGAAQVDFSRALAHCRHDPERYRRAWTIGARRCCRRIRPVTALARRLHRGVSRVRRGAGARRRRCDCDLARAARYVRARGRAAVADRGAAASRRRCGGWPHPRGRFRPAISGSRCRSTARPKCRDSAGPLPRWPAIWPSSYRGSRRPARGRSRQPIQGSVPGHAVARAAYATHGRSGLGAHAADAAARCRACSTGGNRHRAQRRIAAAADRGSARRHRHCRRTRPHDPVPTSLAPRRSMPRSTRSVHGPRRRASRIETAIEDRR